MTTDAARAPLQGIRVLDLSRLLPGPFCSLQLAQLGAEVIKIEAPEGGDPARVLAPELFELVNRGKRSVTLDLRRAEHVQAFHGLVTEADVVLESFRPGVMDRAGCGYDALKRINPRLVYAALTGYGQTGPYRHRPGHDINFRAYAGELDQTGSRGGAPATSNLPVADMAGALSMALGIVAAVLRARTTGRGDKVDVALFDAVLSLQVNQLATQRTLGHALPRGRDVLSGALPVYRTYECADGGHVAVGAIEPKFFLRLCEKLGRPELATWSRAPGEGSLALHEALSSLFASRPRDEWEALLADDETCASAVLTPDEALRDLQVVARGVVSEQHGKPVLGSPIKLIDTAPLSLTPAPALGADNEAVLPADARAQGDSS